MANGGKEAKEQEGSYNYNIVVSATFLQHDILASLPPRQELPAERTECKLMKPLH